MQARGQGGEGVAGVEDVVDDDDVPALVGIAHGFQASELARALSAGVAGEPDAGDFDVVEVDVSRSGRNRDRACAGRAQICVIRGVERRPFNGG